MMSSAAEASKKLASAAPPAPTSAIVEIDKSSRPPVCVSAPSTRRLRSAPAVMVPEAMSKLPATLNEEIITTVVENCGRMVMLPAVTPQSQVQVLAVSDVPKTKRPPSGTVRPLQFNGFEAKSSPPKRVQCWGSRKIVPADPTTPEAVPPAPKEPPVARTVSWEDIVA